MLPADSQHPKVLAPKGDAELGKNRWVDVQFSGSSPALAHQQCQINVCWVNELGLVWKLSSYLFGKAWQLVILLSALAPSTVRARRISGPWWMAIKLNCCFNKSSSNLLIYLNLIYLLLSHRRSLLVLTPQNSCLPGGRQHEKGLRVPILLSGLFGFWAKLDHWWPHAWAHYLTSLPFHFLLQRLGKLSCKATYLPHS